MPLLLILLQRIFDKIHSLLAFDLCVLDVSTHLSDAECTTFFRSLMLLILKGI